jgi:4-amino-4-deoxy-L-arabinose transferase-like glycosyltransferase
VIVGFGFAFMSLETLGIALILLVPAFFIARRSELDSPALTIAFAIGYIVALSYFALVTSGFVNQERVDWGGLAFIGGFACIGVAVLLIGLARLFVLQRDGRPLPGPDGGPA